MARTSITTARYNPFTMEELYSPVLRATEQHLQQQEKYDELANQASVWKYRIGNDSPVALKAYNDFMDRLNAATDDLYNNGINNPSSRDNARALIRENPIPAFAEAYTAHQKALDLRTKDPNNVFAQTMPTFDDALSGTINNIYVNTDDVTKDAAFVGSNIAKTITDNPEYKSILGGQYWQEIQRNGIPTNVYEAAQTGDTSNLNAQDMQLYDIVTREVDNIKNQIGYGNFANNPQALSRIDGAIWNGMSAGLQTKKYSEVANRDHETRGERITNSINQLRLDEMNREKSVMDRLAAGQGTDADKWYARTHGIDPETGAKVSSRASSGAGKTTSRVMSYIPQTISLDAKGNVTGRGDKSINETMSSDKTYHTVPFKELSKGQQTQVLTQMGYTKEEINAMYKETPVQPTGFRNPVNTNVTASEFIGNTELDPEVLSSSLTIYVKDNTKKPGKESDAGLIIKPNSYQTSADFTNDFINSNMFMDALQNLWELGETSNPSVETAGYNEDVQSSVDADLQ